MEKLKFIPEDGFLNSAEYPDPENEAEAREQLYSLHKQTKEFVNNLIGNLENGASSDMNGAAESGTMVKPDGTPATSIADQIAALDRNRVISDDIRYLRMSADGNLEKSADNKVWQELLMSTQIVDETGIVFPKRKKLQFLNAEVSDNGQMIVVKTFGTGGGGSGGTSYSYYIENVTIPKESFNSSNGSPNARVRIVGLKSTDFASVVFDQSALKYQGRCTTEDGYLKVILSEAPTENIAINVIKIDRIAPWIDQDTNKIILIKGTDYSKEIQITDEIGNEYIPTSSDSLLFKVADAQGTTVISKYLSDNTLTITAFETDLFVPGNYNYSVMLETGGKRFVIIDSVIVVEVAGA